MDGGGELGLFDVACQCNQSLGQTSYFHMGRPCA